jgi:Fic family protein
VRSSIARRLGIDTGAGLPIDRHVEGVVEMMLDATQRYDVPLTAKRLFGWHAALFPTGYSGITRIAVGNWRDDSEGAMQVVSGGIGNERAHYEAPAADRIEKEMDAFLTWFEAPDAYDPVLKAALAHLWFVAIHPFDDGNGRIARAIADMALARSERSPMRFYSMSGQILKERKAYYEVLERTQKADMDVTAWMTWFLDCLDRAINGAETVLDSVLSKALFWDAIRDIALNSRQQLMLNKLLDSFEGKLTTAKWAKIAKCSSDTALRDIQDLVAKGVLLIDAAGGRSTSYSLRAFDARM